MNAVQLRGGVPHVVRESVTTTGRQYRLPTETFWLKLRNKGANVIRLYFKEVDFNNDTNYVEVPIAAAATPHGEWEGPVEVPPHQVQATPTSPLDVTTSVWLKAMVGAADIEMVAFQRRG